MISKTKVVVYGASGHTGQLVAGELVARGHEPLLAGRNHGALERVANGLKGVSSIAVAEVGDAKALHAILEGAGVLINCAGPHGDTSFPLALAAIDSGVHYLDTNAVEQVAAKRLFDDLSRAAVQAGIAIVPGMATFGGLGDLLASKVTRGLGPHATMTVAYIVDGWIPTRGSMMTASRAQGAPRLTFEASRFSEALEPARIKAFDFGHPIGERDVVENYPGVDVAMIPQHVLAEAVAVHMTLSTLQEFRAIDPVIAASTDAEARKMTDFAVLVEARRGNSIKRMIARGKDIYGFTATMMGTAIDHLANGPARAGVLSPAQLFDADTFLESLARQGLVLQDPTSDSY
ncbi:saccharopine dehydrogenase NADP-binding domain-containing protein [Pinirhizobacter soli]|uniref:saccharopine dehydrogenase NADP-binding domain-containing protein n=1 Tax=Pinirhizobacter soli TaxID=2786953 RepID=UPI002029D9FF|nr:saccharopine dehydrogenase NADP-binding domain-containing protein [Pinirhizobacter soli]